MKAQTLNVERAAASIRTDTDLGTRDTGEIYLMAGGMLRLDIRRPGGGVDCFQGECWVTQEGDHADYRLKPGDTYPFARRGMVLVQAMGRAARVGINGKWEGAFLKSSSRQIHQGIANVRQ